MTVQLTRPTLLDLNKSCYCFPIERQKIDAHILATSSSDNMHTMLAQRENYFANTVIFLSQDDLVSIRRQVQVIENTIKTDLFQSAVFSRGYNAAYDVQTGTKGAFMGYDFHITKEGPRLIEINSNAGGAFIVNALEQSIGRREEETENKIGQMFLNEWRLAGREGCPRTIAIIDENPEAQFHYPDMCLAVDSLTRQGFTVVVIDPKKLTYDAGILTYGSLVIDMVYNRLTDFNLTGPHTAALAQALLEDAAVVTPNPRHHAFHADKRNLVLLSDMHKNPDALSEPEGQAALSLIPETVLVTPENADGMWAKRKQFFFKPHSGFGSRGVYRGAKLTTKVWSEISKGGYIAQKFIPPSLRAVSVGDDKTELKFDVRAYTYDGDILLLAARIYQGQATNLRTDGGGLAPVLTMDGMRDVSVCL